MIKPISLDEQIFNDVARLLHHLKNKDRFKYMWFLAKLELDLNIYHAKMGIEHNEAVNILEYYSKLWEM